MKARARRGWGMSEAQISMFWRMWGDACAAQGWNRLTAVERDEKRHEFLSSIGFASIKDVGKTVDFDEVKRGLLNLTDHVTNEPDDAGQRRRYLHRIGEQHVELEQLMGGEAALAYLEPVLRQRFGVVAGAKTLSDLPTIELNALVMTLDQILARQRLAQA